MFLPATLGEPLLNFRLIPPGPPPPMIEPIAFGDPSGEDDGNFFFKSSPVNLTVVFGILFLLLLFVLKKVAWGPIISALETREKQIKEALDSAANAKADAEKATADYESIKQEAQVEAQKLLSEAKTAKESMINQAVTEAKTKAENEMKSALNSIEAEKEKAVKEIKSFVVDLSIQAASKLISKNLDDSDNRKFVDETIDEIGKA